jgi:aspartate-semialdehyde dehydrogenase
MASREFSVAVVGASGVVGREMLLTLSERQFPIGSLKALASERSAGSELEFGEQAIRVEKLGPDSFSDVDIALFSAGAGVSKEYGPIAAAAGAIVIDNSSAWRMEEGIPLIVPEVNADVLRRALSDNGKGKGMIIANPNCSTIQLVVVLKPILEQAGIKRVVVSTYQAVSGAGQMGMDELWNQTLGLVSNKEIEVKKFAHQIGFNCLPHCDTFLENGYTKEEMKVVHESRKILGVRDLRVTCTAVRVPVFSCHSESVNVETERALSPEAARELLSSSPGIIVLDDPQENLYPLAAELAGTDASYVGRIRADESVEHGLNMWIVADNLRKGAALNAVQIAELVAGEI